MDSLVSQLRADVKALGLPAGRMVGSPGHAEARRFLCMRMKELRLECYGGASDYPLRPEAFCRHGPGVALLCDGEVWTVPR